MPRSDTFYHATARYALPKACITFLVRNARVENVKVDGVWTYDTQSAILSSLISGIFSEAMAQETYDASLAGLHWDVSFSSAGIRFYCSGFSDRLPDLCLAILEAFVAGQFLHEPYFSSFKDKMIRNIRTFLESRRADSCALYYRDLLLASESQGLDASLVATEATTLETARTHHEELLKNQEWLVECLYTGNVSDSQARGFFEDASVILKAALPPIISRQSMFIPGDSERRLFAGHQVELHFASKSQQEENFAVIATYQSTIPGYRGPLLSTDESLKSSAAIRLINQMLREPLFDELRMKQTLGYIVSCYP
jgi:insulysin